jgi:hypothetical protein
MSAAAALPNYGALEFVTKPVDFDLLKTRLQQLPAGLG